MFKSKRSVLVLQTERIGYEVDVNTNESLHQNRSECLKLRTDYAIVGNKCLNPRDVNVGS